MSTKIREFKTFIDGHDGPLVAAKSEFDAAWIVACGKLKPDGPNEVIIGIDGADDRQYVATATGCYQSFSTDGGWVTRRFSIEVERELI